jgi:hypothetical protein
MLSKADFHLYMVQSIVFLDAAKFFEVVNVIIVAEMKKQNIL